MIKNKLFLIISILLLSSTIGAQNCINCQYQSLPWLLPAYASNSFFAYGQPWFSPYGNLQYLNWQAPGIMIDNSTHMQGNLYPGSGGVGLVKPNIYIDAPEGLTFDLKMNIPKKQLWISSPRYQDGGWKGVVAANGKIKVDEVLWPFIYVDYRAREESFQNERGFCGPKNLVAREMLAILQHLKFNPQELQDFSDHWPTKLPKAREYCVFPQDNKQLKKVAAITINPCFNLTRLYFYVVLWDKPDKPKRFRLRPGKSWTVSLQEDFDEDKPSLREWGVGFPMK